MKKYKITFQKEGRVHNIFIDSEDISKEKLPLNVIKIQEIQKGFIFDKKNSKLKSSEIADLFFELNIILQAKIPLYEALEILLGSTSNKLLKEIIITMKDSLKNGKPIYLSLEPYEKQLGSIVISFFKIAQENGSLKDCIYSLCVLLKSIEENKKLIRKKLNYPLVLLCSLGISLVSIFNFVIPQFEYIFAQYNTKLPIATVALLGLKSFMVDYSIFVAVFFAFLYLLLSFKYKNSELFKYKFDKFIITKLPILGHIIFVNYFHRFFLSLKILLEANYKFQSSIINSSILLKNQYLLDRITTLNKRIQSGESIYDAFVDSGLFDELTLRLINTGEKSNSMYLSVNEIEKIYKQKLDEKIKLFSSLIEPTFIVVIMLLILWVVLAVLVPMWGIGEVIKM